MPRKISKVSVDRVKILLRSVYPLAVSMHYIRQIVTIPISSVRTVCEEILKDQAETIETNSGKVYRWKDEKGS